MATKTSAELRRAAAARHAERPRRLRLRRAQAQPRLIVEVDGYDGHKGRVAFREDRARDRASDRDGLRTARLTCDDVQETPDAVAADLVSEASRRSMASSAKS